MMYWPFFIDSLSRNSLHFELPIGFISNLIFFRGFINLQYFSRQKIFLALSPCRSWRTSPSFVAFATQPLWKSSESCFHLCFFIVHYWSSVKVPFANHVSGSSKHLRFIWLKGTYLSSKSRNDVTGVVNDSLVFCVLIV